MDSKLHFFGMKNGKKCSKLKHRCFYFQDWTIFHQRMSAKLNGRDGCNQSLEGANKHRPDAGWEPSEPVTSVTTRDYLNRKLVLQERYSREPSKEMKI
jgi:hypothetical protein